jgi:choline dehydrogenase
VHAADHALFDAEPRRDGAIGIEWLLFRSGLGATNHFESGGFIRSRAGVRAPGSAVSLPADRHHLRRQGKGERARLPGARRADARDLARRRSRSSRERGDAPRILFNYLSTEGDRQEFRDAIRLTARIFAQKAFDPYRGAELSPGASVTTEAEIDAHIRRKAESAYHPSCSCRMGAATIRSPSSTASSACAERRGCA